MKKQNRNQRRVSLVLLGLGVTLGYIVFDQLTAVALLPNGPSEGAELGNITPVSTRLGMPVVPALAALSETVERPLFLPLRRPLEPVTANPAPTAAVQPVRYTLMGVTVFDGYRVALLKPRTGGRVLRVTKSQRLGGWYVASISARNVLLRRGAHIEKLSLVDTPRKVPNPAAPEVAPSNELERTAAKKSSR